MRKYFLIIGAIIIAAIVVMALTQKQEQGQAGLEYLTETYINQEFGFSFKYPEGFNIGSFESGPDAITVLLQHPEKQEGLQVIATKTAEPIVLTEALIREELPGYSMIDPEPVIIAGQERGVMFTSRNEAFGESREIWFAYNNVLYQLSSYIDFNSFAKEIFATWKFQ